MEDKWHRATDDQLRCQARVGLEYDQIVIKSVGSEDTRCGGGGGNLASPGRSTHVYVLS